MLSCLSVAISPCFLYCRGSVRPFPVPLQRQRPWDSWSERWQNKEPLVFPVRCVTKWHPRVIGTVLLPFRDWGWQDRTGHLCFWQSLARNRYLSGWGQIARTMSCTTYKQCRLTLKPWSLQKGNVLLNVYYKFYFPKSHTFLYFLLSLEYRAFIITNKSLKTVRLCLLSE